MMGGDFGSRAKMKQNPQCDLSIEGQIYIDLIRNSEEARKWLEQGNLVDTDPVIDDEWRRSCLCDY